MFNKPTLNRLLAFLLIAFIAFSMLFNLRAISANQIGVQATFLMRAGRFSQAMSLIQQSFDEETFTNPEIGSRFYQGVMAAYGDDRIDAKQTKQVLDFLAADYQKQVATHPQEVRYYLALGKIYYGLVEILIKEPKSFDASQATAVAYIKKAEAIFRQALPLSPTRQEIYNSLAQITLAQGRNQEARDLLAEAARLNPQVPEFYWNLYLVDYKLGDYQAARADLVYARQPNNVRVHELPAIKHIINFYQEIGDYRELPMLYEEAIKLAPDDESLKQGLAAVKKRLAG